jgi:hypothetical protein
VHVGYQDKLVEELAKGRAMEKTCLPAFRFTPE